MFSINPIPLLKTPKMVLDLYANPLLNHDFWKSFDRGKGLIHQVFGVDSFEFIPPCKANL